MASRLQIQGDESVLCHVTHSNLKSFNADVRFSLQVRELLSSNYSFYYNNIIYSDNSFFKLILCDVYGQLTVEAMKEKLWKKCGTSVDSMSLELYDDTGAKIADLSDNARPFGFYSPMNG